MILTMIYTVPLPTVDLHDSFHLDSPCDRRIYFLRITSYWVLKHTSFKVLLSCFFKKKIINRFLFFICYVLFL